MEGNVIDGVQPNEAHNRKKGRIGYWIVNGSLRPLAERTERPQEIHESGATNLRWVSLASISAHNDNAAVRGSKFGVDSASQYDRIDKQLEQQQQTVNKQQW